MYKIKLFIRRHEKLMYVLSYIYNLPFIIKNFFCGFSNLLRDHLLGTVRFL